MYTMYELYPTRLNEVTRVRFSERRPCSGRTPGLEDSGSRSIYDQNLALHIYRATLSRTQQSLNTIQYKHSCPWYHNVHRAVDSRNLSVFISAISQPELQIVTQQHPPEYMRHTSSKPNGHFRIDLEYCAADHTVPQEGL